LREETTAWPLGCMTRWLVSCMQALAWPSWCKCGFLARLCGNGNEICFSRARLTRCRLRVRRPGFLLRESAHTGNQSQLRSARPVRWWKKAFASVEPGHAWPGSAAQPGPSAYAIQSHPNLFVQLPLTQFPRVGMGAWCPWSRPTPRRELVGAQARWDRWHAACTKHQSVLGWAAGRRVEAEP
jgi:hypothetical protein